MQTYTRRSFIKAASAAALVSTPFLGGGMYMGCNGGHLKSENKVIVFGIDGLDPNIMEKLMAAGQLPTFQKLRADGTYRRLATTNPAESPVVWSSIATGKNPGGHGIFDFIHRNPKNYLPELSLSIINPRNLTNSYRSMFVHPRKSKAFWQICSEQGVPVTVIRWPVTFPAQKVNGKLLAGLGVPDIQGNLGRYTLYTNALRSDQTEVADKVEMKGLIREVQRVGNIIDSVVIGPTTAKLGRRQAVEIPMQIRINPGNQAITIQVGTDTYDIRVGDWSNWMRFNFDLGFGRKVKGIARCYLNQIHPDFSLYLSPIQVDPADAVFPICCPDDYSMRLAEEIGEYHTLGMPEDTNAFEDGSLSADAFLESCETIMREREQMLFRELEHFKAGVFAFVFDTTDRIQHTFWRTQDSEHPFFDKVFADKYGHVIEDYYRRMDAIVSELLKTVDNNTLLLVLSDHGFSTFRKSVHVNSWLTQLGLMVLKAPPSDAEGHPLFKNVDWGKTRAYALGFSSVYLNLEGREREGIVNPREAAQLKRKIVLDLAKLDDPNTGEHVIKQVYDGNEIYSGKYADESPDLVIGFRPGYRASWQTAIGGVPATLFSDNLKKWSGDHLIDPSYVPGVLFSNQQISRNNPTVLDIAPTVLNYIGVDDNAELEGHVLV